MGANRGQLSHNQLFPYDYVYFKAQPPDPTIGLKFPEFPYDYVYFKAGLAGSGHSEEREFPYDYVYFKARHRRTP